MHNLQEENQKTLCESVPNFARARCPQLVTKAQFVCTNFKKAFGKFGKCHSQYDCGNKLSEADIGQLGK